MGAARGETEPEAVRGCAGDLSRGVPGLPGLSTCWRPAEAAAACATRPGVAPESVLALSARGPADKGRRSRCPEGAAVG